MTKSALADAFGHHVWATLTLFDSLADLKRSLRASLCDFQTVKGRLRRLVARCYTRPTNQTASAGS